MAGNLTEDEQIYLRRIINDGFFRDGNQEGKKLMDIIKNTTKLCLAAPHDSDDFVKLARSILNDIDSATKAAEHHSNLSAHYDKETARIEEAIELKKEALGMMKISLHQLELDKEFTMRLCEVAKLPSSHSRIIAPLEQELQQLKLNLDRRQKINREILQICESLKATIDKSDEVKFNK